MQFTIKIYKNRQMIDKCRTHRIRRFFRKIRSINFEDTKIKAYLKVNYGKALDNYGKYVNFYNDGDYDKKADFWLALNAFIEK